MVAATATVLRGSKDRRSANAMVVVVCVIGGRTVKAHCRLVARAAETQWAVTAVARQAAAVGGDVTDSGC